jgi:predicted DNA-binding transcriptional regulator AlpA
MNEGTPMTQNFFSVRDVAAHFGCSVSTVWRLTAAGKLAQPIKIGGMTRWHRTDIEALFAGKAA